MTKSPHPSANRPKPYRVGWDPILFFLAFCTAEIVRAYPGMLDRIRMRHDMPYGPFKFWVQNTVVAGVSLLLIAFLFISARAYKAGAWRFDLRTFRLSPITWTLLACLAAAAALAKFHSPSAGWALTYAAYLLALIGVWLRKEAESELS